MTATTETTRVHEHSFPVQPPEGSIMRPGPCRTCGKTWELNQAEKAMAGALAAMEMAGMPPRPTVVCLCGSTRFYDQFQQANYERTMAGEIVLSVGFYPHAKAVHGHGEGVGHDSAEKVALDELHKRKIDLADYVLVVSDESGYFGDSTAGEILYAVEHGKPVRFAERAAARRADEMDLFL
jgi:hypothetical protein